LGDYRLLRYTMSSEHCWLEEEAYPKQRRKKKRRREQKHSGYSRGRSKGNQQAEA